ncbi:HAD family hydrolase [Georgenia yuyongxinii]|uniref:HAD family hydrolase n=1 Tax=Georgenia yuyongxinii TaxID=2589797 RepID=UPI001E3C2577|nr:HAD family hydrolase [Georgenia yuyongxinii]
MTKLNVARPARYRLAATDIDGTILPHGGTISARTRQALAACADAGTHVVLATGRPPRWVTPILEATGHRGTVIAANGAVVIDSARGMHTRHRLTAATVHDVVHALRRRVKDVLFGVETPHEFRAEAGYRAARGGNVGHLTPRSAAATPEAPRIEQLLDDEPIIKVVALSATLSPDELLAVGREAVGDLAVPTHSSTGLALLELGPRDVSKASTLAAVASSLGVHRTEVIAFGDMPNDVEMLAWSGAGYAMEGGHPEAIAAAPHLAPPAAEDGVAQVLEREVLASSGAPDEMRLPAVPSGR